MRSLYESILDTDEKITTQTGDRVLCLAVDEMIRSGKKNPELIKVLEQKVAIYPVTDDNIFVLVCTYIPLAGDECSLNWIDTSNVTNMGSIIGGLFSINKSNHYCSNHFNGDISKWDVSKVTNMERMFSLSRFNGDIHEWDVSNVLNMKNMFSFSHFRQDIRNWKINKKCNLTDMWRGSIQYSFNEPKK